MVLQGKKKRRDFQRLEHNEEQRTDKQYEELLKGHANQGENDDRYQVRAPPQSSINPSELQVVRCSKPLQSNRCETKTNLSRKRGDDRLMIVTPWIGATYYCIVLISYSYHERLSVKQRELVQEQ